MAIDYTKFNLAIDKGYIKNINEVIDYINSVEMDTNTCEYFETLINKLDGSGDEVENIKNKDELLNVLKGRVLEFRNTEITIKNNKEALKKMQEVNEDLKKISIISTKKEDNDSGKDVDYITFTNKYGEAEVLVCASNNTLNDYIEKNKDKVVSMSAEDIFHYFKEYIHKNLEFQTSSEVRTDISKNEELQDNKVVDPNDQVEKLEMEILEEYKNKYTIPGDIKKSVDPNGERIYTIKDGIFTFKNTEGKRDLVILKAPTINSTEDLLRELDEDNVIESTSLGVNETNIEEGNISEHVEEEKENVSTYEKRDEYDSIPLLDPIDVDMDKLQELLQKRDIYQIELTNDEVRFVDSHLKYLIETLKDDTVKDSLQESIVVDYLFSPCEYKNLDSMMNRYHAYLDNKEVSISNLEIKMCENYMRNIELKKQNIKALEGQKRLILSNDKAAFSSLVMILEIIIIALFVLLFLSLDI